MIFHVLIFVTHKWTFVAAVADVLTYSFMCCYTVRFDLYSTIAIGICNFGPSLWEQKIKKSTFSWKIEIIREVLKNALKSWLLTNLAGPPPTMRHEA